MSGWSVLGLRKRVMRWYSLRFFLMRDESPWGFCFKLRCTMTVFPTAAALLRSSFLSLFGVNTCVTQLHGLQWWWVFNVRPEWGPVEASIMQEIVEVDIEVREWDERIQGHFIISTCHLLAHWLILATFWRRPLMPTCSSGKCTESQCILGRYSFSLVYTGNSVSDLLSFWNVIKYVAEHTHNWSY